MEVMAGMTVKGDEVPDSFRVAPRTADDGRLVDASAAVAVGSSEMVKKKRGRPRKYGPDGVALSPMPISSSIPIWRKEKQRMKKKHKLQFFSSGEKLAFLVGGNFTPHVITVHPGEDVTMKVMSFSQQGARAVCVLSATGTISNVTLRQPTSCGGTLTYEGRFEILSLSGSFTPTEIGGNVSRSGGMSVSLAGPDGRVLGGGLAGLLIAAGPVQVVVGSFLSGGHQLEHKRKKRRSEPATVSPNMDVSGTGREDGCQRSYGGEIEHNMLSMSLHNRENPMQYQEANSGIPLED